MFDNRRMMAWLKSGTLQGVGLFLLMGLFPPALEAQALTVQDARVVDLVGVGIAEPQGIAYHPIRQTLFIVAKNPGRVVEITPEGERINSFLIPEVRKPEGIDFDPVTGDLVICRGNNVLFRASADGSSVSAFLVMDETTDADGIAVHRTRGTFFVTDDDAETVFEFDRTGRVVNRFKTSDLLPDLTEPQGIGFLGTDLVVADDFTKTIYLVSPEGELLQTLLPTKSLGVRDPEGITVIGQERVCAISDNDARMLCFSLPQRQLVVPLGLGLEHAFVGVAAVNTSQAANSLNAYGFTPHGWQTLFDQIDLSGSAQATRLTQEIGCCGRALAGAEPKPPNGVAPEPVQTFALTGQRAPIQGFFMAGDFSLARLDGIGGPVNEARRLVLPIARQTGASRTVLFVYNPNATHSASISLELRPPDGTVAASTTLELPPFGSINQDLAAIFGGDLNSERGYLLLDSNRPVRAFEFLVQPTSLSAASGQIGDQSGFLVAPHFFTGSGVGRTTLSLINLEEEVNTVNLVAYDDLGRRIAQASLEVGGRELFEAEVAALLGLPAGAGLVQGYLVINHTGPQVGGFTARGRLVAMVTFEDGAGQTRSSLALQSDAAPKALFPHVAQARNQGVFQGLALLNWSSNQATILVEAFDHNGIMRDSVELTLGSFQRIVALLDDPRLFGEDFEQQGGYLRVSSDNPLMAFSLFGGSRFLSAIERDIPIGR